MHGKIHGLIMTDAEGRPVVDTYGNVLLFKTKEDATPYIPIGGKIHRVVTARIPRKKSKKSI